ncbi:MAG: hypothetical protein HY352_02165 [Candidatus Omnitrophica bacterium]|nr:hypothetical protein [Candidatus Omnitrophota bacterium]
MKVRTAIFLIAGVVGFTLLLQGCATTLPLWWYQKTADYSLNPRAHQRLAAAYRREAAQLRKRAAFHQTMAEKVRENLSWSGPQERDVWLAHCEALVKKYQEAAEASNALAEEHEGHVEVLEGLRELRKGQ